MLWKPLGYVLSVYKRVEDVGSEERPFISIALDYTTDGSTARDDV